MIPDLELAKACQASYHASASSLPMPPSGVFCCVSQGSDGVKIVAFRGSVTLQDWITDFTFAPIVVREHPQLGKMHAGFLDDAESIVDAVAQAVGSDVYDITGHSLGGADAVVVAALMTLRGHPPRQVVTFGCPRVGMADFVDFMKPLTIRQYRRGNDIVPEVPRDVPPEFCFVETRAPIGVGVAQIQFLRCHSIDGYVADVGAYLARQNVGAAA